jgi:hypothetical protein
VMSAQSELAWKFPTFVTVLAAEQVTVYPILPHNQSDRLITRGVESSSTIVDDVINMTTLLELCVLVLYKELHICYVAQHVIHHFNRRTTLFSTYNRRYE